MKKVLLGLVVTSVLVVGCGASTSNTENTDTTDTTPEAPETTEATEAPEKEDMEVSEGNVDFTLLNPEGAVPMGDAELTLAVQDSATGEPITTDSLVVDITMPMDGMDPMLTEVEVSPGSEPGQYTIATYFSMEGMWMMDASLEEGEQQGKAHFMIEAQ